MTLRMILVTGIIISFISCSTIENDLSKNNLMGNIKSITSQTFKATEKFGDYSKEELQFELIEEYNEQGYLISRTFPENKTNTVYNYDENWLIIEEISFDGKYNETTTTKFKYDENGNVYEKVSLDSNKKLTSITKAKYNKKNNLVEESVYDSKGEIQWKEVITYNVAGDTVLHQQYNSNGDIERKTKFVNNNLLEYEMYFGGRLALKYVYTYNDAGIYTEMIEIEFEFDNRRKDKTSLTKYEYQFDKKGNWVLKIPYTDGQIDKVFERNIEYYN